MLVSIKGGRFSLVSLVLCDSTISG